MQRIFDVLFSGLALLILLPLLVPLALILRFSGEGEVFFLQERVGKDGQLFKLLKFATMLKDSPNLYTGVVTVKDDPRVLRLGRLLRKTKINELPQLINVILGDMSIVGPRPQAPRCYNAFPIELQRVIVQTKPGLSGIGSIVFRNEEAMLAAHGDSLDFYENVIAPYKGQVEAWYASNQKMLYYFAIIFVTVWVVLLPSSGIVWRVFKDLPQPPNRLKGLLNR